MPLDTVLALPLKEWGLFLKAVLGHVHRSELSQPRVSLIRGLGVLIEYYLVSFQKKPEPQDANTHKRIGILTHSNLLSKYSSK